MISASSAFVTAAWNKAAVAWSAYAQPAAARPVQLVGPLHLLQRPGELRRGGERPGGVRCAGRPVLFYQRGWMEQQWRVEQCRSGRADGLLQLLAVQ